MGIAWAKSSFFSKCCKDGLQRKSTKQERWKLPSLRTTLLWALVHFRSVYANRLYLPARNAGIRIVDNSPAKGRSLFHIRQGKSSSSWGIIISISSRWSFFLCCSWSWHRCIWLGAAAQEGKSAQALAACRTLSEELTEMRFFLARRRIFQYELLDLPCQIAWLDLSKLTSKKSRAIEYDSQFLLQRDPRSSSITSSLAFVQL